MDKQDVTSAGDKVGDSPAVEYGARLGYAASALLHALMGYLALRIAWGNTAGQTGDQSGALGLLAGQPGGKIALWVCVLGFALLAIWQVAEAVSGRNETSDRAKAAAKAVMYAALGVTSATFATGGSSSSSHQTRDVTSTLMSNGAGRVLVGAIGLAVIAAGAYHAYKGVKKKFLEDLEKNPGAIADWLGMIGYIAKGAALGVVGALFVVGAFRGSSAETTGLDGALKTLREQPAGPVLLTVVAAGIIAFAGYTAFRARHARV